jgi:hypothetical protein
MRKPAGLLILISLCLSLAISLATSAQGPSPGSPKTYPLSTWSNVTCRAKGRFQDRDYCSSAIIDQIVADGKSAIPVLISQITDTRWIPEPVYDYWPRIRTGELAHFILSDLFTDDTWQKSTMPSLFPAQKCDAAAWVCWADFRKTHSLKEIQGRWLAFWKANENRIYWDGKSRCFRLSAHQSTPGFIISQ